MQRGSDMIATIIAGVLGGIAVTSGVWIYAERQKEPPPSVDVAGVVEQVLQLHKPAANLTQPDLLAVPCSSEYIASNGDLLCREMFCRMTTRGVDAKTSGKECEAIGNIINKTHVIELCKSQEDFDACIDVFDKRL